MGFRQVGLVCLPRCSDRFKPIEARAPSNLSVAKRRAPVHEFTYGDMLDHPNNRSVRMEISLRRKRYLRPRNVFRYLTKRNRQLRIAQLGLFSQCFDRGLGRILPGQQGSLNLKPWDNPHVGQARNQIQNIW